MLDDVNNVAGAVIENGSCAGCLNQLLDEDYISALGQNWHLECFRCSACDAKLSSWYFEKDGLLFCQSDFWTKYGEACQQCSQVITGPVMAAGDHRFHPECFCCELCTAFIGDGEAYALIERSKLYCGGCYEKVMRPLSRGNRRHAIQLVEIPPCGPGGLPRHPSAAPLLRLAPDSHRGLTIKHVDVSCGLMALHIGDRILEINGTPVKDQPISHIENLICYSDTVLQLTIEHDPDHCNKKSNNQSQPPTIKENISCDDMNCENSDICMNDNKNMPNVSSVNEPIISNSIQQNIEKCVNQNLCNNIVINHSKDEVDNLKIIPNLSPGANRERVFKKRADDGTIIGGARARQLWRRAGLNRTPHPCPLGEKERSSSMSQLLEGSVCEHPDSCEGGGVFCDLARTRSFRVDARPPSTVFRATDLLQGELLGSGFFGQVFKVTHRDTNEVMVLKQLYRVDEDAQKNFLKEVAVLRSLSHPNVLRFVGVLYKEQRLHLVTEYIGGGTLRSLLESSRTPPWAERAGYARDISAGLAYLHRMNIIHRDLNSHNCLVREDKTVIVADFGLARIVKRTGVSGSLERSKRGSARERKKRYTVVGNPYWMAPEMMKGNVYDEKVDIFSFGIVLCEIIGRVHADPDFLPRNSDFGLNQSLFKDKFCQGCPEPLFKIAFLCCNLNPDKRPPFEVIEVWLESINMHLFTQQSIPAELTKDIENYNALADSYISKSLEEIKPELVLPVSSLPAPDTKRIKVESIDDSKSSLTKSKSGDILEPESEIKTNSFPPEIKRGLGPKCISASHLYLPNKLVSSKSSLSKSQNALSSTPAGYILSTDNKTISITKVDDVREWLDNPIVLKKDKTLPENTAEKRQSLKMDTSDNDFDFQNKSRKIDTTNFNGIDSVNEIPNNFKNPNAGLLRILKSKSQNYSNVGMKDTIETPCYLRNQSVDELESVKKDLMDIEFTDKYSKSERYTQDKDVCSSDSDTIEEIEPLPVSTSPFKRLFKNDSKAYTVNKVESSLTPNDNMKNPLTLSNVKLLRQNFEPKSIDSSMDKNKSFNVKKLLSPKFSRKSLAAMNNPLSKIFLNNSNSPPTIENNSTPGKTKNTPKGRSTFFISKPPAEPLDVANGLSVEGPSSQAYVESNDLTNIKPKNSKYKLSKMWPPNSCETNEVNLNKTSNFGKCMTPLLRRHNRQSEDLSSVGRFSYREKRSSPIKPLPDKKVSISESKKLLSTFEKPLKNHAPNTTEISVDNFTSESTNMTKNELLSPLVRCSNFKNIPVLNELGKVEEVTNLKDCSVPKQPEMNAQNQKSKINDLGITNSNYVSLANLRIQCPLLGNPNDSIVKKNISKFDSPVNDKLVQIKRCASDFETTNNHLSLENTPL